MKQFKIYASMQNQNEINSLLKIAFNDKNAILSDSGSSINIVLKDLFSKTIITVDIILNSDSSGSFSEHINYVSNVFSDKKYEDAATNKHISVQLQFINLVLIIHSTNDISDEILNVFKSISPKVPNFMLLEDNTLINREGHIVYDNTGKKLDATLTVYAAQNMVKMPLSDNSEESLNRKNNSIAFLNSINIPTLEVLPTLPRAEKISLRSKDEICERATALLFIVQYACEVAQGGDLKRGRDAIVSLLEKYEALDCLTTSEQEFLYTDKPEVNQAIRISWQYEAYWALIWALGYVDTLDFPTKTCNSTLAINALSQFDFYDDFYDNSKLRSKEEILDAADLLFRLNWVCMNAHSKKEKPAGNLSLGVVAERHRALQWLLNLNGKSNKPENTL